MTEHTESCQSCTYFVTSAGRTGICSYPTLLYILRATQAGHCTNWHPSTAARRQARRDAARAEAR